MQWLTAHGPRIRPFYRAALAGAPGSPILTLRDYMATATNERPRQMALKVLRALLAELRDESLDKLYATEEGLEHVRKLHEELEVVAA